MRKNWFSSMNWNKSGMDGPGEGERGADMEWIQRGKQGQEQRQKNHH